MMKRVLSWSPVQPPACRETSALLTGLVFLEVCCLCLDYEYAEWLGALDCIHHMVDDLCISCSCGQTSNIQNRFLYLSETQFSPFEELSSVLNIWIIDVVLYNFTIRTDFWWHLLRCYGLPFHLVHCGLRRCSVVGSCNGCCKATFFDVAPVNRLC